MAVKLGDAFVAVTAKDELDKGFEAARKKTTSFIGNLASGIAQGMGQAVAAGIGNVIRAGVAEIGKSIGAASDLQESMSKITVVFGESSQEILTWSKTTATALGQSQQQALEAAGSFGNLFTSMGVTREEAADLSMSLVEIASDLASFNNIRPEEALEKLRAGIVGETEPLRTLGINLNAAALEAEAMALGLGESSEELTDQEKILARYNIILRQSANAQGDFARTSEGLANQQRILVAQIENGRAALGQAFTPIASVLLRALNDLIRDVSGYGDGIIRALAEGMVDGIIYLLPVIRTIRDIFTYWLQPGSPPRILPDIDKWGKATLEEYLRGMTGADFDILRDLGGSIEGILRSFVATGQVQETNLVELVFGSQAAIAGAIAEWKQAGSVSASTFAEIRRAAGPAGDSVASLVDAYFDLQNASEQATRAQEELTRVTARYDNILSPLLDKLDENQRRQQELRDRQRLQELGEIIADPYADVEDRQAARLEAEEIRLRQRIAAIEEERDTAVEAEQKKVDAAKKEEEAKRAIFEREQSALDAKVKTNALIAEEIALRERLANEALAEQEAALRELEQAQREAERAQKEQEAAAKAHAAELERLYQAQLSYNLTIADTPGKIALMKLELTRYKEGSVEYFQTLEQIYNLEQQLAKEREAGAGGAGLLPPVLPPVDSIDVPSWATDLADRLQTEIDKAFGKEGVGGVSQALANGLSGPAPQVQGISQDIKDFVDALKALTGAITTITPPLAAIAKLFDETGESAGTTADDVEESTNQTVSAVDRMTANIRTTMAILNGDWKTAWELTKTNMIRVHGEEDSAVVTWLGDMIFKVGQWRTNHEREWGLGLSNTSKSLGEWLTQTSTKISEFDLSASASALLSNFWEGLKSYWDTNIAPWWEEKTKWIADLLPGSEPKNPASPLRGLADRGEALMENLGRGMQAGAQQLQAQFTGNLAALPAAAAGTVNNSHSYGPINLVFQGPVTPETIRTAVATAEDELRRRGFK